MVLFGGVGMSITLKYQDRFKTILPDFLIVEQPYPYDKDKMMIGKQSLYYYSQSMYFQALSAWSIVFFKRSRLISPLYYLYATIGLLVATYRTDYFSHP